MRKEFLILFICFFFCLTSYSQDTLNKKPADTTDISKLLEEQLKSENANTSQLITGTFKTTRLIDGHSVENTAKGVLDFKISHRFGPFSGGPGEFFGFDEAKMRLGFDYGITNKLMVGIGRSTDQGKVFDAFLKWKILRQSTGKVKMPVTANYVAGIALQSASVPTPVDPVAQEQLKHFNEHYSNRLSFVHQFIIGRKFSEGLSLQIMPTLVHRNFSQDQGPNNVYAVGIGGRQKLSKRTTFNAEYYYQLPESKVPGSKNALSFGFDIETGGHVFQLMVTNSMSMTESTFITGNKSGSRPNGDMRFGFNISRVFSLGKKHTKEW
jgi:hypothetical protein